MGWQNIGGAIAPLPCSYGHDPNVNQPNYGPNLYNLKYIYIYPVCRICNLKIV